jgi:hypothetical protein
MPLSWFDSSQNRGIGFPSAHLKADRTGILSHAIG